MVFQSIGLSSMPTKCTLKASESASSSHIAGYLTNLVASLAIVISLHGCGSTVDATIRTANANFDRQEAKRSHSIYEESVARYQAMADRGDPKGMYYMAIVYAVGEFNKPEDKKDVGGILRRYEEAVAAGSNDAKVALGRMLVEGVTLPHTYLDGALPEVQRDPKRGIALLKSAAEQSCSYSQPLMSIGRCREREASIALILWTLYDNGHMGIQKDLEQAEIWRAHHLQCEPIIEEINRRTGCDKLF